MRLTLTAIVIIFANILISQNATAQTKPVITNAVKKSYNGSNLSCATANDGEITVYAAGGSGKYLYSKDGGNTYQSSNVFTGLRNNVTYALFVKDSETRVVSDGKWVTIDFLSPVTISSALQVISTVKCNDAADGEIQVTAWGGTGALKYSIDNGQTFQSTGTFTGVPAGTYRVYIVDQNGCNVTSNAVTLANPSPITARIISQTNTTCSYNRGSVTIRGEGSTGDYNASIDGGGFQWFSRSSNYTFSNLASGKHQIIIKDNYTNCLGSLEVTIGAPITAEMSGDVVLCSGGTPALNINIAAQEGNLFTAEYTNTSGAKFTAKNLVKGNNLITLSAHKDSDTYTLVSVKNEKNCAGSVSGMAVISMREMTWLGYTSEWNDANNWGCGFVPNSSTNVFIPATQHDPVITGGVGAVKDINIEKGASVIVKSKLQVAGNISTEGFFDATGGTVEFNGNQAQAFSGSSFVNKTIHHLLISNKTLSLIDKLNDTLNITGSIAFGVSKATFNTSNNLTLKSTAKGTASVEDLTGGGLYSGNTIRGEAVVERYIPARKGWYFLSVPTKTKQTINEAWQEGESLNQTSLKGLGMQVTANVIPSVDNGIDVKSGSPSLKSYHAPSGKFEAINNTKTKFNPSITGYFAFIRGDRTSNAFNSPVTETTLRTKGELYTGNQKINIIPGKLTPVNNPYASSIDLKKLNPSKSTFLYIWDTERGGNFGYGAYQTLMWDAAAESYRVIPGGGKYDLRSENPASPNLLESGAAFWIQSATSSPFDFNEDVKTNGEAKTSGNRFAGKEDKTATINTTIYQVSNDGSALLLDGTLQQFDETFGNAVDDFDAKKFDNSSENLSIKNNVEKLTVERRQPLSINDTIQYNLTSVRVQKYRIEVEIANFPTADLEAFFEDAYLKTVTPLSLKGKTEINFNIENIPGSYAADRFRIVFKQAKILPVTFTSVKAVQKKNDIEVEWKVADESNMVEYMLAESSDGKSFHTIATVAATNNGSAVYTSLDENVSSGNHYYRVSAKDLSGKITYTQIVKVQVGNEVAAISIYPNPAVNAKVNVDIKGQSAGTYYLQLFNPLGQVIVSKQIFHDGRSSKETIDWSKLAARGNYQLQLTSPDGTSKSYSILY